MAKEKAERLQNSQSSNNHIQQTDGVEITFYTDPLCCWSWAMRPQFRALLENFADLSVTYKMAGLLPSWNNFSDSVNSIQKPVHMGPEWMHAKERSGANIDPGIWMSDPPASSFPACIAVKCAELQSKEASAHYLHFLQEAVMVKNKNIARTEMLLEVAHSLPAQFPSFNLLTFREDLLGQRGKDAFRLDWQEVKYKAITRLPTLVFRSDNRVPILLSGYQSYDSLERTVASFSI
ncbi:DsbA family protein [Flavitalea sp. BT771]|uniref:DsbA family oxidoreductase n=1 Tax=Flavitalea sp. BT771 TaxID=3063329 RepID=UPI0026E17DC7|nr:DsbA family protein [Flavitalea sp. BT771]MDO6430255.1 DsbA family protein [Flavitalea sp. BT771]MDV6219605.1 DsbA family protein [Flavitalea sp. BT771]